MIKEPDELTLHSELQEVVFYEVAHQLWPNLDLAAPVICLRTHARYKILQPVFVSNGERWFMVIQSMTHMTTWMDTVLSIYSISRHGHDLNASLSVVYHYTKLRWARATFWTWHLRLWKEHSHLNRYLNVWLWWNILNDKMIVNSIFTIQAFEIQLGKMELDAWNYDTL